MESNSTLNSGFSMRQGLILNPTFQLKNLENKARRLAGGGITPSRLGIRDQGSLNGPNPSASNADKNKELMEVAKKFEALLIHQMLKAMRRTVHKSDLLNSFSLQQYESMLDEEIANEMAEHKGIGLADMLYYQLSRLEGNTNPQSAGDSAAGQKVKPNA